jgi:HSP20 family protein
MSTIIRWNPIRELAAMQSAMDRIFDESWRDVRPAFEGNSLPIDAHESDRAYTIVANLPGVTAEEIDINLHENVLTIGVEVNREEREEGERTLVEERFYGKLSRSFRLPQPVDSDNVEASYNNGVLTLTLPKTEEAQPRRIAVKTHDMLKSNN